MIGLIGKRVLTGSTCTHSVVKAGLTHWEPEPPWLFMLMNWSHKPQYLFMWAGTCCLGSNLTDSGSVFSECDHITPEHTSAACFYYRSSMGALELYYNDTTPTMIILSTITVRTLITNAISTITINTNPYTSRHFYPPGYIYILWKMQLRHNDKNTV